MLRTLHCVVNIRATSVGTTLGVTVAQVLGLLSKMVIAYLKTTVLRIKQYVYVLVDILLIILVLKIMFVN